MARPKHGSCLPMFVRRCLTKRRVPRSPSGSDESSAMSMVIENASSAGRPPLRDQQWVVSGRGFDDPPHDPPVLADLAVAGEPELLVGRQGAVEEETCGNCVSAFWVALDGAAAEARDEVEGAGERGCGYALSAGGPCRRSNRRSASQARSVGPFSYAARFLMLAALRPVGRTGTSRHRHHRRTRVPHARFPRELESSFRSRFRRRLGSTAVRVKAHAPAAAEDAVVGLNQTGECSPSRLIESFNSVLRPLHRAAA